MLLDLALSIAALLAAPALPLDQDPAETPKEAPPAQDDGSSLRDRIRDRQRAALPVVPELKRADGTVVKPGELPPGASPAARERWESLAAELTKEEPVRSFLLEFYLRQQPRDRPQSNDLRLTFSFLAPSFVRAKLESGRTHLRGPQGDYLLEKNQEAIRLVGREGAEDRKQLDQMAAIASNFVGLTDPRTLRLATLETLDSPPAGIHPKHKSALAPLVWLRATSPDFYLGPQGPATDGAPPLYRADLGIDPETKEVRFALINELFEGKPLRSGAMLVNMKAHVKRDALLVPHEVDIYEVDPESMPPRFYASPTSQLWLKKDRGRLRARLQPEDFLPPKS